MKFLVFVFIFLLTVSCFSNDGTEEIPEESNLSYGADFSIVKKMEDFGAVHKVNGVAKECFQIFKKNNYTWARFRIFHSPNHIGPICNDLDYTIALAKKAKSFGYKIFLDFHYSDTWADPEKQFTPAAWENLPIEILSYSVTKYTTKVLDNMQNAGLLSEMV